MVVPDKTQPPVFAPQARDPIAEAEALQRAYRERRRRYAWKYGKPYAQDLEKPEPAVLDGADPEDG